MVKITVDLTESGCSKPGCTHKYSLPNRHHTRHEKTWINQWDRFGPPTYKGERDLGRSMYLRLKERYYQFRDKDVVRICEWHHAEIHDVYRAIVRQAEARFKRKRDIFTYEQAAWTMRECRKYCYEWLNKQTPGYKPERARRLGKW
jgi:hypothetical protein